MNPASCFRVDVQRSLLPCDPYEAIASFDGLKRSERLFLVSDVKRMLLRMDHEKADRRVRTKHRGG